MARIVGAYLPDIQFNAVNYHAPKVRGFLLQPLLHRAQIYCNDVSYTVSTGFMFGRFPPYSII